MTRRPGSEFGRLLHGKMTDMQAPGSKGGELIPNNPCGRDLDVRQDLLAMLSASEDPRTPPQRCFKVEALGDLGVDVLYKSFFSRMGIIIERMCHCCKETFPKPSVQVKYKWFNCMESRRWMTNSLNSFGENRQDRSPFLWVRGIVPLVWSCL